MEKILKHKHIIFLILLCVLIFISHTLYVLVTHQYPEWDEQNYLGAAVKFYGVVKNYTSETWLQYINGLTYRQPLYGLLIAIPLFIFGTAQTYKIALEINVFFYILTIISIYFLGREYLSKKASLIAAFAFAFYGFPLFYLHFTYSETVATSLIWFSILLLAKTKNFSLPKYSVTFSIIFGLALLVRWITGIFVGGALLLTFLLSVFQLFKNGFKKAKSFIMSIGAFLLFGILFPLLIYYLPNAVQFVNYYKAQTTLGPIWEATTKHPDLPGIGNSFSIHSIMFYFNVLSQQTIFFTLLFFVGILLAFIFYKKYLFLLLTFIVPYGALTFLSTLKDDRYIVPIYPSMALLSAVVFDHVHWRRIKKALILVTIVIGCLNFLASSWGIGPMGQQGLKDIVLPSFIKHPRRMYLTPMVWPPRKEMFNTEITLNTIKSDYRGKNNPKIYITFTYRPYITSLYTLVTYERINEFNLLTDNGSYYNVFHNIEAADYLLIKDKYPIDKEFNNPASKDFYAMAFGARQFNKALSYTDKDLQTNFQVLKIVPLPNDKTNIIILKKIKLLTSIELENIAQKFVNIDEQNSVTIQRALERVTKESL